VKGQYQPFQLLKQVPYSLLVPVLFQNTYPGSFLFALLDGRKVLESNLE